MQLQTNLFKKKQIVHSQKVENNYVIELKKACFKMVKRFKNYFINLKIMYPFLLLIQGIFVTIRFLKEISKF